MNDGGSNSWVQIKWSLFSWGVCELINWQTLNHQHHKWLLNASIRTLKSRKTKGVDKRLSEKAFKSISQPWHVDTLFPHISCERAAQLIFLVLTSPLRQCSRNAPTDCQCQLVAVKGRERRESSALSGNTPHAPQVTHSARCWITEKLLLSRGGHAVNVHFSEGVKFDSGRSGPPLSVFDKLSRTLWFCECQFVKYPKWGVTGLPDDVDLNREVNEPGGNLFSIDLFPLYLIDESRRKSAKSLCPCEQIIWGGLS